MRPNVREYSARHPTVASAHRFACLPDCGSIRVLTASSRELTNCELTSVLRPSTRAKHLIAHEVIFSVCRLSIWRKFSTQSTDLACNFLDRCRPSAVNEPLNSVCG